MPVSTPEKRCFSDEFRPTNTNSPNLDECADLQRPGILEYEPQAVSPPRTKSKKSQYCRNSSKRKPVDFSTNSHFEKDQQGNMHGRSCVPQKQFPENDRSAVTDNSDNTTLNNDGPSWPGVVVPVGVPHMGEIWKGSCFFLWKPHKGRRNSSESTAKQQELVFLKIHPTEGNGIPLLYFLPRKIMEKHYSRNNENGVNGSSSYRGSSSGKDHYARQVAPDRRQATVSNKFVIRISTWNVRTMYQSGKLEIVKLEMERLKINILGVCETRWKHTGDFQSDNYRIIYSGGERHEHGVGVILDKERAKCVMGHWELSDRVMLVKLRGNPFNINIIVVYAPTSESSGEATNEFYEILEKAKEQCKSQEVIIVMGDLNAKVGNDQIGGQGMVGQHGLGVRNDRGDRFRNAIKQSKAYPGADSGSDHNPVICKLKVKLRKRKQSKTDAKLRYAALKNDLTLKERYAVEVKNRFEVLQQDGETQWESLKKALVKTAQELLPKQKKSQRKKWMTDEILELIKKRQKISKGSVEYKEADRKIKSKCREAKEAWINEKCEDIERYKNTEPSHMHKQIKELAGKKACSSSGCLRAKDGTVILEKDKILDIAEDEKLYSDLGVAGAQDSVERAVNVLLQFKNGFNANEPVADFHAGMKFLQYGFKNFHDARTNSDCTTVLSKDILDGSRAVKGKLIHDLSAKVVDTYIMQTSQNGAHVKHKGNADWLASTNIKNLEAKFDCSKSGRKLTFAHDGKRCLDHEKSNGLHQVETKVALYQDDSMFCYQFSLLEFGMIVANFYDAISEGDGPTCTQSNLEPLPQTRNGYGGNIPLGLMLEHFNNTMKNVIKQLGPNNTNNKAVDRYAKAITTNMKLMENFDQEFKLKRRSGKHNPAASIATDLQKIVNQLVSQDEQQYKNGRSNRHFTNTNPSLLDDFKIQDMYSWIETHKKNMYLKRGRR
eukprot:gene18471-20322_t